MSITLRFQARDRSLTGVDTDPSATPASGDTDGIVEEGRPELGRFRIFRIN
jgi:hypothetical protein